MDDFNASKGSRILLLLAVFSIIIVFFIAFFKYYVNEDFLIYIKDYCDPNKEKCFIHQCDADDTRCSAFPNGKFYYKILYKKQYNIMHDCGGGECQEIICRSGEHSCQIFYCSETNLSEFGLDDTCIDDLSE